MKHIDVFLPASLFDDFAADDRLNHTLGLATLGFADLAAGVVSIMKSGELLRAGLEYGALSPTSWKTASVQMAGSAVVATAAAAAGVTTGAMTDLDKIPLFKIGGVAIDAVDTADRIKAVILTFCPESIDLGAGITIYRLPDAERIPSELSTFMESNLRAWNAVESQGQSYGINLRDRVNRFEESMISSLIPDSTSFTMTLEEALGIAIPGAAEIQAALAADVDPAQLPTIADDDVIDDDQDTQASIADLGFNPANPGSPPTALQDDAGVLPSTSILTSQPHSVLGISLVDGTDPLDAGICSVPHDSSLDSIGSAPSVTDDGGMDVIASDDLSDLGYGGISAVGADRDGMSVTDDAIDVGADDTDTFATADDVCAQAALDLPDVVPPPVPLVAEGGESAQTADVGP